MLEPVETLVGVLDNVGRELRELVDAIGENVCVGGVTTGGMQDWCGGDRNRAVISCLCGWSERVDDSVQLAIALFAEDAIEEIREGVHSWDNGGERTDA